MNKEGKHNFKLFTYLLVFLTAIFLVQAALSSVTNLSPDPQVWITDSIAELNFTCDESAYETSYDANLSIDFQSNGTYQLMQSNLPVTTNGTIANFTLTGLEDGIHQWAVTCFNTTNSTSATSTPWVIKLDSVAPEVIYTTPYNTSQLYYTDTAVTFGAICLDDNPNQVYYDIDSVRNRTNTYENNTLNNYQVNLADGAHYWNAVCDDDAGNIGSNETNTTFIVDTARPVQTLVTPLDDSWDLDGTVSFTFTIVENNLQSCQLWNGTTAGGMNLREDNAVNGTDFEDIVFADGTYLFGTNCTDLASTTEVWSSNYTLNIDTADPVDTVNLTSPLNDSTGTDLTPIFNWINISDTNFKEYTLIIDTEPTFSSPDYIMHITDNTNTVELNESLIADTSYFWKVNVTALSGRGSDSNETARKYSTDSTCGSLGAGYNYCGIVRDATSVWDASYTASGITLDQIQLETDASYVYLYNSTDHSFITYQNGTSTNRYSALTTGDTVLVYRSTAGLWPVASYVGRVWNAVATVPDDTWSVNFTNVTDGYNLFSIRTQAGRSFSSISSSIESQGWNTTNTPSGNESLKYLTYVNNSAIGETCGPTARDCGQFVSFRYNWTINENTNIDFGEAVWGYLYGSTKEGQSAYWNRSCDYTVDDSCGSAGVQ